MVDNLLKKVNGLKPIADELGVPLSQLAIVSSVIIGATKVSQVSLICYLIMILLYILHALAFVLHNSDLSTSLFRLRHYPLIGEDDFKHACFISTTSV